MAEATQEHLEPSNHKSCVLKVSIHCEACKKKVKKILSQVYGVDFVEVDRQQHKVTVIGSVDADTLIKKLVKSGKRAEPWPEKPNTTEKISSNGETKEKPIIEKLNDTPTVDPQPPSNPLSVTTSKVQNISVKEQVTTKNTEISSGVAKSDENTGSLAKNSEESNSKILKPESKGKKDDEDKLPADDKNINGGGAGKKKKKKGQNRNINPSEHSSGTVPAHGRLEKDGPLQSTNHSPPRDHYYQPPHHYFSPPVYGMSYNTANPLSSYTASYYAPQQTSYSYAYTYPAPPPFQEVQPSQPLDSFEMFSDENPNGCSIA